jgi:hypothetical protein
MMKVNQSSCDDVVVQFTTRDGLSEVKMMRDAMFQIRTVGHLQSQAILHPCYCILEVERFLKATRSAGGHRS